jgi:hypothetical protein
MLLLLSHATMRALRLPRPWAMPLWVLAAAVAAVCLVENRLPISQRRPLRAALLTSAAGGCAAQRCRR